MYQEPVMTVQVPVCFLLTHPASRLSVRPMSHAPLQASVTLPVNALKLNNK